MTATKIGMCTFRSSPLTVTIRRSSSGDNRSHSLGVSRAATGRRILQFVRYFIMTCGLRYAGAAHMMEWTCEAQGEGCADNKAGIGFAFDRRPTAVVENRRGQPTLRVDRPLFASHAFTSDQGVAV